MRRLLPRLRQQVADDYVNVVDEIKSKRTGGVVHCGYLADSWGLAAVASAFSLSPDTSKYRQIAKIEALQILTRVLHKDMAYDSEIMPEHTARELGVSFLQGFEDESAAFFTNIDYSRAGQQLNLDVWCGPSWNPVTNATFDAGVIAISANRSACLWVEDED